MQKYLFYISIEMTSGARDIGTVISTKKNLGIEVPRRELILEDQASIVNEGNSCFIVTMLCQKCPGTVKPLNNDPPRGRNKVIVQRCLLFKKSNCFSNKKN
jgi:hypothetical protein